MPAKVNFLLVSELETFRWLFSWSRAKKYCKKLVPAL
jgi:hypothetical protein